jgi:hypothetical protein
MVEESEQSDANSARSGAAREDARQAGKAIELYAIFRNQIVAEDVLIFHRMTWLMTSQAFLIALLAAVYSGKVSATIFGHDATSFVHWFLAGLGITVSLVIALGIHAAQCEIEYLGKTYRKAYGQEIEAKRESDRKTPLNLPDITGGGRNHKSGKFPAYVLPALCFLLWIGIAFAIHPAANQVKEDIPCGQSPTSVSPQR